MIRPQCSKCSPTARTLWSRVAALAVCLLLARPAAADVEIKLGTLAPAGSAWHLALKEMGQKWKELSGGKVTVRVYPGGVVGNEGDMVRKMRISQINAAALTVVGLHEITPEPQALSVPMGIQSYEALDYVMAKLEPELNKTLEAKGYVPILWSEVGFVYFFSTKPIKTTADLKTAKLFAWDGDPASVEAWKRAGCAPVVLSSTDIIPSLNTGLLDTVATSPLYALTSRIYQKANQMNDLPWAMLTGATVVKKEVWDQVPAELRPQLVEVARKIGRRLALDGRQANVDAIAKMKLQGLKVVKAEDLPGWQKAANLANEIVRGKVVPAEMFDRVQGLNKEFLATKGSKK